MRCELSKLATPVLTFFRLLSITSYQFLVASKATKRVIGIEENRKALVQAHSKAL